jgi:hypothetical protein
VSNYVTTFWGKTYCVLLLRADEAATTSRYDAATEAGVHASLSLVVLADL